MTMMHMTIADIANEYAPYNRMPAFIVGANDYIDFAKAGIRRACEYRGVDEQAYDRGFEAAMRVQRHNEWIERNVGLN